MDEPRDKPPAPQGSVPQFVSPMQVTAPQPTWPGYPPLLPPPPPAPTKEKGHGWDAAKLLSAAIFIVTVIFGAGKLVGKLESIETNQKADAEQQAHRNRLHEDRYDKMKSAFDAQAGQLAALAEQVKQLARARYGRHREAAPAIDARP